MNTTEKSRPSTGEVSPARFRKIRVDDLGLDQSEMARLLEYSHSQRVSAIERGKVDIPLRVKLIMLALESGWRPGNWSSLTGRTE